jgi:DNA-binding transcriptional regulator YhcF (GntR family)
VARAYRELEAAGLLVGRGRHGTFVPDRLPTSADAAAELAREARAYARRAGQLGASPEEALRAARRALSQRPA